jgi:GAF domain-containing protein
MKNDDGRNEDYVLQVRDTTHQYMGALIQENERLRALVNDLEEQRRQDEQQLGMAASERAKLAERIDQIEVESQGLLNQFHEVERQNSDLASLYVASYRLHETIERSEVIAVIEEIVVNLIGSEELAIFELDADTGKFKLIDSLGIDPNDLQRVRLNETRIEETSEALQEVVKTGQRYLVNSIDGEVVDEDSGLTACIPLALDGKLIGAIAVFRLLEQKARRFAPLDFELFDLLATHAASALYCSERLASK